MPTLDPATNRALPDSAIQRVLFAANDVHVYQIPPLTSTAGFAASSWTSPTRPTAQQIFTARVRVIETAVAGAELKADIVLEDARTGDLFAAAPYTSAAVVQQAQDSSRFFAVRVQGEGGMKATLGVGFEDRSPAFDFAIALTEVRKVLGMEAIGANKGGAARGKAVEEETAKKDFSLKEGEKIHIQVGSKGRPRPSASASSGGQEQDDTAGLFSIAPPPPAGKGLFGVAALATPPSSSKQAAEEFGFDDGEFGEFQ